MAGQTIAVGVAGGGTSGQTLAWAVAEARMTGARLLVCHVCSPDSPLAARVGRHVPIAMLELADPALSRALTGARGWLGDRRVHLTIDTGDVGTALVDTARAADLLVVGAPQRPGWTERGSTTHYLVRHAPCPTVSVRPAGLVRGPFAGHVVIGVDGSEPSRAAVEFGFGHAAAHRRPVAAVHVAPRAAQDIWFDETTLETHFTVEPPDLDFLAGEVDPWHHKYPDTPLKRVLFGGPALPGLLRAAAGARLLVVGDRGRGPAVRAVLGSVSHGAVDRAGCPVAITHADHHQTGGPL